MNRRYLIESWEQGSSYGPPSVVARLVHLHRDEQLLWVARISSAAFSGAFFWFGIFALAIGGLMGLGVPWGQSLEEYCGPDPSRPCRSLFNTGWLCMIIEITLSIPMFWKALKAKYSPWVIAYAITKTHAVYLNESKPTKIRFIDLAKYPARLEPSGSVAFGPMSAKQLPFERLEPALADRAVYWATAKRFGFPKEQVAIQ